MYSFFSSKNFNTKSIVLSPSRNVIWLILSFTEQKIGNRNMIRDNRHVIVLRTLKFFCHGFPHIGLLGSEQSAISLWLLLWMEGWVIMWLCQILYILLSPISVHQSTTMLTQRNRGTNCEYQIKRTNHLGDSGTKNNPMSCMIHGTVPGNMTQRNC